MAIEIEKLKILFAEKDFKPHWKDISKEEYHKDKSAINSSSFVKMMKSENAFARSFWGKPKEPTEPMKFGTLAHLAILEGEKFRNRYVVMPEFVGLTLDGKESKNSKEAKLKREDWLANQSPDAIVVTEEEREKLFSMIDSVLSNEQAAELLKNGKPEAIGYWKDEKTGLRLKMAADFISFNLDILADLKTCQDSREEYFRKSVERFRYDIQIAFYNEGVRAITGKEPGSRAWIAVESEDPFEVVIHDVGPYYEAYGNHEFRKRLDLLKTAIDNNYFPQSGKDIMVLEPSIWMQRKYAQQGVLNE